MTLNIQKKLLHNGSEELHKYTAISSTLHLDAMLLLNQQFRQFFLAPESLNPYTHIVFKTQMN